MFQIHIDEFSGESFSLTGTLKDISRKQGVLLHSGLGKKKNLFHIVGKTPIFSIREKSIFCHSSQTVTFFSNIFFVLQRILDKKYCKQQKLIPFCGGIIGYIAYDYVHHAAFSLYGIPSAESWKGVDLLNFVFFQDIDIWSEWEDRRWRVTQSVTKQFFNFLEELKESETSQNKKRGRCIDIFDSSSDSKDFYKSSVEHAIQKIREGIVYEVNISRQVCGETKLPCHLLAEKMFTANPTNQEAYWKNENFSLISTSSELYFQTKKQKIMSIPIKGTISSREDVKNLLQNPKIQAELAMTVDLLRDDFHAFCVSGSVCVKNFMSVENYVNVRQTTAEVFATMREGRNWMQMLQYGFPPASILGCPRATSIGLIYSLESFPRGLYTGCLGYACYCGDSFWSVLIRSVCLQKDRYVYRVGGGITMDSIPENEYQETVYKEETLRSVLQQH